jgi:predicted HTH domain antitoxin
MPTSLTVQLPDSFVKSFDIPPKKLPEFIRQTLAVELYREGRLSLGKARELAGFGNKWEMVRLLSEKGVAIDYSGDDAAADLRTLGTLLP